VFLAVALESKGTYSNAQVFTLLAAAVAISTTRIEGFVIVFALSLVFIAKGYFDKRLATAISATSVGSLVVWLVDFHAKILFDSPALVLSAATLWIGAHWVIYAKPLGWLKQNLVVASIASMIAGLVAGYFVNPEVVTTSFMGQLQNVFAGVGLWGFSFWWLVLVLVLVGYRQKPETYRLLILVVVVLVVSTLFTKMFDGFPSLGHAHWKDSVNRIWIQYYVLFYGLAFVGLLASPRFKRSK
jgi:hypothetical protein